MDAASRASAFERWSRITDPPLIILAVAMIPLLIIPITMKLTPEAARWFPVADWAIWAAFAIDYSVRLYLAPNRRRFLKTHIPDLVVVVIPVLRPLRVFRVLRLARSVAALGRGFRDVGGILRSRGLIYILPLMLLVMFIAAWAVWEIERSSDSATIKTLPDALWWAVTTMTTVGADRVPVTGGGRALAVVLMITGIALLGVLTATIAAYFVEHGEHKEGIEAKLSDITKRLDQIQERLEERK